VLDVTGSQGPYIASVKESIENICTDIQRSERLSSSLVHRYGLIIFRDHPPQDTSFITREYSFVSSVSEFIPIIRALPGASGGGDTPEAVTAALANALRMGWRAEATRVIVLVADAPPHGIGGDGDGFPDGVPGGESSSKNARMAMNAKAIHYRR